MNTSFLSRYIAIGGLVLSFFIVVLPVQAFDPSQPLSGDTVLECGDGSAIGVDQLGNTIYNICPISKISVPFKNLEMATLSILIILLIIVTSVLVAKRYMMSDDADALNKIGKALVTKVLIFVALTVLIGGGLNVFWDALVKPEYTNFIKTLTTLDVSTVSHAYAANTTQQHLPNAFVVDSPYDLLVIFYQLMMRWILIPLLIAFWIRAGFTFVTAQGNPEHIKLAKERLLRAFIGTIILMVMLGLAFAFRDTANQIVG